MTDFFFLEYISLQIADHFPWGYSFCFRFLSNRVGLELIWQKFAEIGGYIFARARIANKTTMTTDQPERVAWWVRIVFQCRCRYPCPRACPSVSRWTGPSSYCSGQSRSLDKSPNAFPRSSEPKHSWLGKKGTVKSKYGFQ